MSFPHGGRPTEATRAQRLASSRGFPCEQARIIQNEESRQWWMVDGVEGLVSLRSSSRACSDAAPRDLRSKSREVSARGDDKGEEQQQSWPATRSNRRLVAYDLV
jgi:hypothetical protein